MQTIVLSADWVSEIPSFSGTGASVTASTQPSNAALLKGTAGPNKINGKAAKDLLKGLGGNDILNGLGGDDRLFGGTGNDILNGGKGADKLIGGAGDDTLKAGKGADVLKGGKGADTFYFKLKDGTKNVIKDFKAGTDEIFVKSKDGTLPGGISNVVNGDDRVIKVGDKLEIRLKGAADEVATLTFTEDGLLFV